MPTALAIIGGLVLIIILIFAGFHWLKPEHLRLKLKWNCLELELKRTLVEQAVEPPIEQGKVGGDGR